MAALIVLLPMAALFQTAAIGDSGAMVVQRGQDDQPGEPKGVFTLRLLEAPVARRDDPRAYTSIVDHLSPGTTIHRRVEISNTTSRTLSIDLYAAAASIAKRTFTYAAGRAQNELTEWTSVDHPVLKLVPDSKKTARITIRVPPTASRGERYGVVWAEVASTGAGTVKVVNRVGIRIYLDVGPGGEPPSAFEILELVPARSAQGEPQLTAHIRNTGERALEITGQLWLSNGPAGLQAGPFAVPPGTSLLPGDTAQVTATLDKQLPDGPWQARLWLRSGRVEHTATGTITFPAAGVGKAINLNASHIPFYVAAVAVLACMMILFIVRRRRVRTR
ncbi:hypothetical protein [Nonomuraea helvata]|uniref:Peptidase n=1 Tax=Nonomuraea helvata TaxID=37484 RepID=A0ABV5RTE7_9ACTN